MKLKLVNAWICEAGVDLFRGTAFLSPIFSSNLSLPRAGACSLLASEQIFSQIPHKFSNVFQLVRSALDHLLKNL
jgi:hypothetical protein